MEEARLGALLAKVRRGNGRAIEELANWKTMGDQFPQPVAAVAALAEALDAAQSSARVAAAQALTYFHSFAEAAIPALVGCLASADAATRNATAATLCKIGPPAEHIPALLAILSEALTGQDLWERQNAAVAIGGLGSRARDAVSALLQCLEKGDEASEDAARALGEIGPEAAPAVATLAQALRAKDDRLRAAAAEALGSIGPAAAPAAPGLIALLDDQGEAASEAFTALNRLGAAVVPALLAAWPMAGGLARLKIINCLGLIGPAAIAARPLLGDCAAASDKTIRDAALLALQRLANPSSR